jgi:protein-L-isoaspartate(D-aspartate) O-methyltransferase
MIRRPIVLLACLLPTGAVAAPPSGSDQPAVVIADDRAAERAAMVNAVANLAETADVAEARRLDRRVLEAMRKVPRHLFVPDNVRARAYANRPLPIGHQATISQPYIVALMTHLLRVEPGQRVLEVGTGSGYQAAILAAVGARVHSIEIVEPLARDAAARLRRLGYAAVNVRAGDGYAGWPEAAPFDRIIVTAGAPHIPQPLLDQLKPGGRMVIPVTRGAEGEELMLVLKDRSGRIRQRKVTDVLFVPLTRSPG